MKLKLISILAGAVVLIIPFNGFYAHAETIQPAQAFPALSGVELSQQQKLQIQQIVRDTRSQIQSVLTTEQQDLFKKSFAEGKGAREAIFSMNLTAAQKAKMPSIFQSARSQMISTLTLRQRQQILQNFGSLLLQQSQ